MPSDEKNTHSASFEKDIILYMDLFSGRTDCYGYNKICIKSPLVKEVYSEHIRGTKRIGCYPIFNGKYVKWAAIDIDENNFEQAITIQSKFSHLSMPVYIEASKSKGFHIWIFFSSAIEALKIRLVLEMVQDELGLSHELFPKQDAVAEAGFGNFIFLPLFGGDIVHNRTVFLNARNEIIISKLEHLNKIELINPSLIDEIIELNDLKRKHTVITSQSQPLGHLNDESIKILPCIENMRKGVKAGNRDIICFRIASYYKDRGMFKPDVIDILKVWNEKNEQPAGKEFKETDIIKTVESVWKGAYRGYGCEDPIVSQFCDVNNCPMASAKKRKQQIEEGVITMTFRDEKVMIFKKKEYEYRLQRFEFTKAGKFKCSLTLSKDDKVIHKDFIDLDIASHRKRYIAASKDESIDDDLIKLDSLVRKQLEKEEKERLDAKKQLYVMTEQEKGEAIKKFEATPHILSEIIHLTNLMGVKGEEQLRLMAYLCFTSRITEDPISITVKGEASSGKSYSCQNIMKLIPEEGIKYMTRATQQAFYHMDEDGLEHRIIYINEAPGQEDADYSIRSAQSEGDIILLMPVKDPTTGDMHTVEKRVRGPVGFLTTTTKAAIFDENETRNFSVFSDDSSDLTRRIGEITIRRAQGERFEVDKKEINLWKNMQRLLNPDYDVIIPYAREVFSAFPDNPVRIRRDRERFRILLNVITLLHQFHREQKQGPNGEQYLISTLADYYIGKIVAENILTYTILELGPSAEELWKAICEEELSYNYTFQTHIEVPYNFTYRTIADKIGWKKDKVKKWMHILTKNNLVEYLDKSPGGQRKESVFKISKENTQWGVKSYSFLPSVEELFDKYPCDKMLFYNPMTMQKVNPISTDVPEGLEDEII